MSPSGFPGYPTPLEWCARPVARKSAHRGLSYERDGGHLIKGVWAVERVSGPRAQEPKRRQTLLRAASALLAVGAVALFWVAFTQFGDAGSPGLARDRASFEEELMRDARISVAFGLAGCFALLGAFACHRRIRTWNPGPPLDPQP